MSESPTENTAGKTPGKITVREVAVLGLLLGLMEAGKRMLDFLPNVEVITLLFIIYAIWLDKKAYILAVAFTMLETMVWGVHNWVVMYLYMWPLLITVVRLRKRRGEVTHGFCCILAGVFGLFFGALCSIPYWFIGGPSMAFTWWVAGIPYDVIHCVSNFLICLILFRPVDSLMARAHNLGYF